MSTTISPNDGAGVLYTQEGVGTTPGYSSIDLRRAGAEGAQEGVVAGNSTEAGGWLVTQRAAGANLSVDIAANVALVRVQGDSVTNQGMYTVAPHSAVINEVITAADGTHPRIDQVIVEVKDHHHDSGGSNIARTRVLAGTPTSGATLDNRTGAAALPSSAVRLADVLVAASDTAISTSEIRDRRPWARGASWAYKRTAGDYAVTSNGTYVALDATNLQQRMEFSGNGPIEVSVAGSVFENNAPTYLLSLRILDAVTSANFDGGTNLLTQSLTTTSATYLIGRSLTLPSIAGGSRLLTLQAKIDAAATATIRGSATEPFFLSIKERAVPLLGNGTT